eukprot:g15288.t1
MPLKPPSKQIVYETEFHLFETPLQLRLSPCNVGERDVLPDSQIQQNHRPPSQTAAPFELPRLLSTSNAHLYGRQVNLFMSSRKRRPCDGNVGWPVRNEEEDEDEDEEASEEVEEVEVQDEEAAEAAEDDDEGCDEGYDDVDSEEENEEEVELTVEVVENESERDSESQASHPTPSQTQHITHRARGGNLESKRPGTPPSKRQKLEASPTPEESPASAAATATPSTSGSAQGW